MIVVFGSVNLDLVARVERLPQPGETLAGESFAMLPGGKGANQALAARRAGAEVALHAAVGSDAFADAALAHLRAGGVALDGVCRVCAPTGVALIHVDAQGENAITVIGGANAAADPAQIPESRLHRGSTLLMQLEVPVEAVLALAVRARARGLRVMLNAAPAQPLSQTLLASLDVLIVNEQEAATLAQSLGISSAPAAFAATVLRRFGCAAIVTLGEEGALAAVDGHLYVAPSPRVQVVDSTGAGDAFCGSLAAALDRQASWPSALADGIAAGALACQRSGAQPALPEAAAIAVLARQVNSTVTASTLG